MYLFESYRILYESYQKFYLKFPGDLLDPEFPRQFSQVMAAFDTFSQQILIVFSSVNPADNRRSQLTTSPLYITAQNLMLEWVAFMERTNVVFKNGMIPHRKQIQLLLTTLVSGMGRVMELLASEKRQTFRPTGAAVHLSKLIGRIRFEAIEVMKKPRTKRFVDFNVKEYSELIGEAIKTISELFDHQMPKFSLEAGQSLRIRADMISACSRIAAVMEGASLFDEHLKALKDDMVLFNTELNSVHKRLRLPFVVGLGVGDETEEEEEEIES